MIQTLRNYILVLLLSALNSTVTAEIIEKRKIVFCDQTKIVLDAVRKDYGEDPVWYGKDQSTLTQYILTINREQNTWTLIQFNENVACILGVGDGSKILMKLGSPTIY